MGRLEMSRLKSKASVNIVAAVMAASVLVQTAPASAGGMVGGMTGEAAARLPAEFSAAAPGSFGKRIASHAGTLAAAVARSWAVARRAEAAAMPGIDQTIRTSSTGRAASPAAAGQVEDVFGSVAISFRRLPALQKIKPSYRQMTPPEGNGSPLAACAGGGCSQPMTAIAAAVDALHGVGFAHKVRTVNAIVNAHVTYRRDADNYGVVDHWATPGETLERGSGDCEDYAILKMALLARLGVPASSMSVVVLRDERRDVFHAVLSLRTNRGHLILDNVRDRVLMDRDLPHYLPLYSISAAGKGFIHGRRSGGQPLLAGGVPFGAIAPGEGPSPAMAAMALGAPDMRAAGR